MALRVPMSACSLSSRYGRGMNMSVCTCCGFSFSAAFSPSSDRPRVVLGHGGCRPGLLVGVQAHWHHARPQVHRLRPKEAGRQDVQDGHVSIVHVRWPGRTKVISDRSSNILPLTHATNGCLPALFLAATKRRRSCAGACRNGSTRRWATATPPSSTYRACGCRSTSAASMTSNQRCETAVAAAAAAWLSSQPINGLWQLQSHSWSLPSTIHHIGRGAQG